MPTEMSFSEKLWEAKEKYLNSEQAWADKQELESSVKALLKEEVQAWMDAHDIKGNIVVQMSLSAYNGLNMRVDYIRVWNNHYSSGRYHGRLNVLAVGTRSIRHMIAHGDTRPPGGWREWAVNLTHKARTDPAFQGEDLAFSFEGRMLNLIQEMFYVFEPGCWKDKIG